MTVQNITSNIKHELIGLVSDVATLGVYNVGSTFYATDSKDKFVYTEAGWKEKTRAYDSANEMYKVGSMQKKWRDSFGGTELDTTKWESSVAAGGTIAASGGLLTMGSGVGIAEESFILSKEVFTIPFKMSIGLTLSQRIVDQTFMVEMVSVDPVTLAVDDKHCASMLFDGTTVTQGKYRVQNSATTPLTSAAVTLPTTATNGMYEIEPFGDEVWFHGATLDSTSARSNSYRRHQQIPDPNGKYKIRLRWVNGAIAPLSNTNAVVQYIACQDYAELTCEITSGRGNSVAGQGIYATVSGTVTASNTAGSAAHDAVVSGNPVRMAGRAITGNYTAVASGDVADFVTTSVGAQVVRPFSIPELGWQFTCTTPIIATADLVAKVAGAAGVRNYITDFQFHNTSAVGTEIVIKDGATVIWRGYAPAAMTTPTIVSLNTPIRGTAATAINVACITTASNTYVAVQGFQAP